MDRKHCTLLGNAENPQTHHLALRHASCMNAGKDMTKIYEGGTDMNHHDEEGGNEAEMKKTGKSDENARKTDAKEGHGQAAATQRQQSSDEEGRIIDEDLKSQDMDEPSTDPNAEWSPGSSQSVG